MKLFKYFTKKDSLLMSISILFIAMQVWLDLKLPDYMSEITRLITSPDSQMHDIYVAGAWMLACALGSLVISILVSVLAARISSSYGARIRGVLFNKVLSFSMEEMSDFSTASLITRSTNDVTQVQTLIVMGLQVMVKAPILATWAIIKISNKSWQWTAATGVAVLILLIVVGLCILFALPKFKILQSLIDKLNNAMRENLTGIRVVRAYNGEDYQEAKFESVNETLMRTNLFTDRTMAILMPVIQLIMSGLTLSIYWIGAVLINNASVPEKMTLFSDMVVFSSYAMQVVMAFMMLIMIFIMLPRVVVSVARIQEVLSTDTKIKDGSGVTTTSTKGSIEFKQVNFKYPEANEYVLEDISFVAQPGETVAFIGSTGSGKSTLINLLPRLFEATSGQVLVNGQDVKNFTQAQLHQLIGYVPQKAKLFQGTVYSNIAYGTDNLPLDRAQRAAQTAQASEFIERLDEGYDSPVSAGGNNLSGGQKQRLAIARAIAKDPEIFIFDDSFSALDYRTDKKLRQALKADCQSATKLIVAQRIGTIKDADRIIVLDEGRIVGNGTHDDLMANCPTYQEIAYSQLTKEELA